MQKAHYHLRTCVLDILPKQTSQVATDLCSPLALSHGHTQDAALLLLHDTPAPETYFGDAKGEMKSENEQFCFDFAPPPQ